MGDLNRTNPNLLPQINFYDPDRRLPVGLLAPASAERSLSLGGNSTITVGALQPQALEALSVQEPVLNPAVTQYTTNIMGMPVINTRESYVEVRARYVYETLPISVTYGERRDKRTVRGRIGADALPSSVQPFRGACLRI